MSTHKLFLISLIALVTFGWNDAKACSMVKITKHGKTMVGNNEDMWSLESKIWFENGTGDDYGVAYVGHRNNFPQGGINQAGLAYDGFTLNPKELKNQAGKKRITDLPFFIKETMKKCATIGEVQAFMEQFDRSRISSGMFLFVDKTGDYLVVEADTLIMGNDPYYVLVNFRPSEVKNPEAVKIPRYHKGLDLLETKQDTSYTFCAAVMDTMKACRGSLGDGTLYTSVYNLDKGLIYLYFYHSFKDVITLNLEKELAKGDHSIDMPGLFPENSEYVQFMNYKTPFNSKVTRWLLMGLWGFIFISSFYFFIRLIRVLIQFRGSALKKSANPVMILVLVNSLALLILLPVLVVIEPIYYFGIEGSLGKFPLTQIEYFPLLILALIIPIGLFNFTILKDKLWRRFPKWMLTINTLVYLSSIFLFIYWDILIPK